jgi:hypothetical protein
MHIEITATSLSLVKNIPARPVMRPRSATAPLIGSIHASSPVSARPVFILSISTRAPTNSARPCQSSAAQRLALCHDYAEAAVSWSVPFVEGVLSAEAGFAARRVSMKIPPPRPAASVSHFGIGL